MPDCDTPDLDHFIIRMRELGLTTAVIAWQEEYNQVPDVSGVIFENVAHFTVLGYHRPSSSIIRCHLQGDKKARVLVAEQLTTAGFQVEQRTRNEVKYRTGRD